MELECSVAVARTLGENFSQDMGLVVTDRLERFPSIIRSTRGCENQSQDNGTGEDENAVSFEFHGGLTVNSSL
jgi:hypothetical protein